MSNLPTSHALQEFGEQAARFLAEDKVRRITIKLSDFKRFERIYQKPPLKKDLLTGEMVPDYPARGTKEAAELYRLSMDFLQYVDFFKEYDIVDDVTGEVIQTMPAMFIQPVTMTSEEADQIARENYKLHTSGAPSHHAEVAFAKLNAMFIQTQLDHLPDLMKERDRQIKIRQEAEAKIAGLKTGMPATPDYRPDGERPTIIGVDPGSDTGSVTIVAKPTNAEWDLDD